VQRINVKQRVRRYLPRSTPAQKANLGRAGRPIGRRIGWGWWRQIGRVKA
jgi:hypothetical protein